MPIILKIVLGAIRYVPMAIPAIQLVISTFRRKKNMTEDEGTVETSAEIKALADVVIKDLKEIGGELKEFKGGIKAIVTNIPDVVKAVERLSIDLKLTGAKKRELAIEVVNRLVDVPLVPEKGEAILIGFIIDAAVAAFNKYGKDWISKIVD